VTASRRVGGTRHLELNLGRAPPVEIELSPERASSSNHGRIAFRPSKWKLFRNGQKVGGTSPSKVENLFALRR